MAQFKLVNGEQLNADLALVAEAIREKTGETEPLAFPGGFVQALSAEGLSDLELYITNQLTEYTSNLTGNPCRAECFRNCASLEQASFPYLTRTALQMFHTCSNLKRVYLPSLEYLTTGTFFQCFALEEVVMPVVTDLGNTSFSKCSALKRLDCPNVSWIGTNTFLDCTSLETLILRRNKVATMSNTNSFAGSGIALGTGYVYVPAALLEQYQNANRWVNHASQIRAIEDYPEICGGGT